MLEEVEKGVLHLMVALQPVGSEGRAREAAEAGSAASSVRSARHWQLTWTLLSAQVVGVGKEETLAQTIDEMGGTQAGA